MKKILKQLLAVVLLAGLVTGCEKKEVLPFYQPGSTTVVTSSSNAVEIKASDSLNTVLTLSWTSPKYATDVLTYKYIVQIDTAGGNFLNGYSETLTGLTEAQLSASFTGLDMNNILISFGAPFGQATTLIARVVSSYSNNNEQLASAPVTINVTPFQYAFDLSVSAHGPFVISMANKDQNMQVFSWSKPNVGTGSYTYKLQYDKKGNNFASAKSLDLGNVTSYTATGANLNKFAQDAGIPNDQAGDVDFRVMAVINGIETVLSTVQTFTITPTELIAYLHVPGDYQSWNPAAAPMLASLNAESFEGYVNMTSANGFKFTSQADWNGTNYGDGGPGKLSTSGGNLSLPVGYYLINANTINLTWSSTLITTWGVIGDATPGSWSTSTPLIYDPVANVWKATVNFSGSGSFKFRANNDWAINLGGSPTYLEYNGANIASPSAGNHVVTLDLRNPLKYTYTIQ